jgi:colanic acid biosynthesis glycosyl transferase WcaI
VVTGFPNYPTGQIAPGYRVARRTDEVSAEGIQISRVALYPSHDGSYVRRLANYGSFAMSASTSALSTLRDVDAIWVYNSPTTIGLPSWLSRLRGGPPHLMHVLDLWPDSLLFSGFINSRAYAVAEPLIERWCQFTYRQAAEIAGISRGICDALIGRGVPAGKVHYIPLWADENLYQPRPRDEALAAQLGVGEDFVLLYAGNLGHTQGLDCLLDVLARVTDLSHFHCLIAGSGLAESHLRKRATQLRLANVTFLGRWPPADIGSLMSVGDLHLVSLADRPLTAITLPSKLPATLASGTAIIACAVGEPARVVIDAGAGWAVPPNDPLAFEKALREAYALQRYGVSKLGVAARHCYDRNFSLSRGVSMVESILTALAQESPSLKHRSSLTAETPANALAP